MGCKPMPQLMKSRFWPAALLILMPLIGLAGMAVYGLKQHEKSVEAQAMRDSRVQTVASAWFSILDEALEASPRVVLYDAIPIPQPPSPEALALDAALANPEETSLRKLCNFDSHAPVPLTASGLPVPCLAAWHLARLTKSEADIISAANMALITAPCSLSETILTELATAFPQTPGADTWLARWQDVETRRVRVRGCGIMNESANKRAEFVDAFPFEGNPPPLNFVSRTPERGIRYLTNPELRQLYKQLTEEARPYLPSWAVIEIRAADSTSWDALSRPPRGPWKQPYTFANMNYRHWRIGVGPLDFHAIYTEHNQLVRWATALISTAALTALLGLIFIRRTLQRERRLNEMKSQFVSSVSHELRAPIGSVRLMAEALASGKVTGAPAAEFHRLIASEGSRLSALIENVLDFARIEQARKQYTFAETDLPALIQETARLMTPQAEARQQTIRLDLQPLPCDPAVDAPAIQQTLINLLDNALKFSPPQSEIVISLTCTTVEGDVRRPASSETRSTKPVRGLVTSPSTSVQTFTLTITDPGPGIPACEHEKVFDRFYRLGNELQRETQGTGIGLAIVKHAVEGHGGTVQVVSPVKDSTHGTSMEIVLPFKR
jgi:signal transduction histidine kinase